MKKVSVLYSQMKIEIIRFMSYFGGFAPVTSGSFVANALYTKGTSVINIKK